MTQCERVVRHMKDYGSISTKEAMDEYGIMRLGSAFLICGICDTTFRELGKRARIGTEKKPGGLSTRWCKATGEGLNE